jgi:1-acyl-sn-glycerol-3-phosphate acyltransferase
MKLNFFKKTLSKIASLVYPVKIYGKENLPKGNAVIVCNHFSIADCVYILKLNLNEDIHVLSKKEIIDNKIIGPILKSYGAIPIDRQKPDVRTLMNIIKILKGDDNKLVIFPEGTRNRTGTIKLQPLKGGSAIFAVRSKCPIVPVMILKKGRVFVRNKMIVGKPFELLEFYDKKNSEEYFLIMEDIIYSKMVDEQNKLLELVKK